MTTAIPARVDEDGRSLYGRRGRDTNYALLKMQGGAGRHDHQQLGRRGPRRDDTMVVQIDGHGGFRPWPGVFRLPHPIGGPRRRKPSLRPPGPGPAST